MEREWMVQVLNDLKTFAEMNGMQSLADKLDEATDMADRSLRAADETHGTGLNSHGAQSRSTDREVERHH